MTQLMDLVAQAVQGGTTRQISQQIGGDERSTQTAISTALPMLVAALARNSATPEGAESLHGALARDHDGSLLDDLGGFLGHAQDGPGPGILRHVLGGRQETVQQAVSKQSGLDSAKVGQLLVLLAPIVMSALGRAQRQRGLDASGLAGALGREREQLGQASPDLMGMATRLLDRDGDGSIVDELGGLAGKLFGNR
jgi:hypothetical protein